MKGAHAESTIALRARQLLPDPQWSLGIEETKGAVRALGLNRVCFSIWLISVHDALRRGGQVNPASLSEDSMQRSFFSKISFRDLRPAG
jgi:hypothetical protein